MKIEAQKHKYIKFSTIKHGESFWYGNILCIRTTNDSYNAVDLSGGKLLQIILAASVTSANTKIVNCK